MKRIYLVRHGESVGNLNNVLGGKDLKLSEAGLLQAAQLAERLENIDIDKLVVSDFVRAQETIAPTATVKNLEPEMVSAFGEMLEPSKYFGLPEDGEEIEEFRVERNANIDNPNFDALDGENFHQLHSRVNEAKTYLEKLPDNNILVVSHSYYLRYFLVSVLLEAETPSVVILNALKKLDMSNTGISYVTFNDGKWKIHIINDHAHFAE